MGGIGWRERGKGPVKKGARRLPPLMQQEAGRPATNATLCRPWQAMRLFVGEPVWTPYNRPADEMAERQQYLQAIAAH